MPEEHRKMTSREKIQAAIRDLDLTIASVFIPFSNSRNHGAKHPSLNWRITLQRAGRAVLTTDYSAGMAHCPSYAAPVAVTWDRPKTMWRETVTRWECEHGFRAKAFLRYSGFSSGGKPEPISPDSCDVIWSLSRDCDVLDSAGFESWAQELGYDSDSRKAESLFQECLDLALKFRAAVGDSGIQLLRDAGQDY